MHVRVYSAMLSIFTHTSESPLVLDTRVQPQAGKHHATTAWGKLLQWRTGWYGLESHIGAELAATSAELAATSAERQWVNF